MTNQVPTSNSKPATVKGLNRINLLPIAVLVKPNVLNSFPSAANANVDFVSCFPSAADVDGSFLSHYALYRK